MFPNGDYLELRECLNDGYPIIIDISYRQFNPSNPIDLGNYSICYYEHFRQVFYRNISQLTTIEEFIGIVPLSSGEDAEFTVQ